MEIEMLRTSVGRRRLRTHSRNKNRNGNGIVVYLRGLPPLVKIWIEIEIEMLYTSKRVHDFFQPADE